MSCAILLHEGHTYGTPNQTGGWSRRSRNMVPRAGRWVFLPPFPDELSLTKLGSCSSGFRGRANKFLSEPLVPDARSLDSSWQLEPGGRYPTTTSRWPLWPRVDGSGIFHPWTNE